MLIRGYLRHLDGCGIFGGGDDHPTACDCGMLRAEGAIEDLRTGLSELVSAIQDGMRRHAAGDPNAIKSNMISATLRQAEEALKKSH
jgi:hypothetical protein